LSSGTLVFDIETHDAGQLYTLRPEEMYRLGGYWWKGGSKVLTPDLEEMREQIRKAKWIIGHNIWMFDLPVIFGVHSTECLERVIDGDLFVYDTWVHAVLVNPAPYTYINRHGQTAKADKPEKMRSWFSLDEQAYQLGVPGKTHDLKELAHEFGDPSLPKKERIRDGFGKIPLDDERYRDYLLGDLEASKAVSIKLLEKGPLDAYALREQEIQARAQVISSNGLRVFVDKAQARVDELAARREVVLGELQEKYGFPTEGDSPWDTNPGKVAILAALADHGIKPNKDWPKTPAHEKREEKIAESMRKVHKLRVQIAEWAEQIESGELPERSVKARRGWIERAEREAEELANNPLPPAFGLSLAGETLLKLTEGTPAADLGQALAELKGQRSLAQLALDSVHPDGFVHPEITMLQRSGRWSTTEPGLTVWTSRGEGAVEKSYFGPDNEDHVLLEIDYSNADARGVAAMSGDKKYAERFLPGADGHLINAWAAWGKDVVGTDKDDPVTAKYRQKAKPLGHGWSYGGRAKTLAAMSGVPLKDAETFVDGMDDTFRGVVAWQDRCRKFARAHGYVLNEWGRKLWVEKGREFTQAPALLGQNATREIICDAILAMPIKVLKTVKANIHDALLFSVPRKHFEECKAYLEQLMTTSFKPRHGGQRIEFPVEAGPPGENWQLAGH
jgi:DNA polymerase-1